MLLTARPAGRRPADVFAAIAREVGRIVGLPLVVVWRYDAEQTTATVIGACGSGLLGLADRLAVLDGQLRVESPVGGGTLVAADIPVADQLPRRFRPKYRF